jgi:CheY-like chemotaxis protein
VEDDSVVRFMLGAYLRGAGHEVELAADGLEGWNKARENLGRFDVVVTDYDMPKFSGVQLVEQLRELNFRGRVVVFSSSLLPRDRERFEAMGVHAIIEKGAAPGPLLAAVEREPGADLVPRGR